MKHGPDLALRPPVGAEPASSATVSRMQFNARAAVRPGLHVAYFAFAIAALLAQGLLVPQQTSRAPLLLLVGFGAWGASSGARFLLNRRPENFALQPAHLFIPVLLSTYAIFAFDASPAVARFSPGSPDSMPGLHINQHAYFAAMLCGLAIFAGWYGSRPGRLTETLVALQVVLISVMYERFLATPAAVPVLVLTAMALVLLRLAPLDRAGAPPARPILWLALPLGAFVFAAFISASFSDDPSASLAAAGKMLALAVMALMLCDVIRAERQRRLVVLSIIVPAVIVALLVTADVINIGRALGFSYAFRNRIELAAGVEVNPLGLSLAVGILLIAGSMSQIRSIAIRVAALAALIPLVLALVVTYSVGSLLGLACGFVTLAVFELTRAQPKQQGGRPFGPLALFGAIGIVVAAAYVFPPPTRHAFAAIVDDPSTGRSRSDLWSWSLRDFKANPVAGVGPTQYWPRVRELPEFPFRDVTKIFERRRLLGHDATQWRFLLITHPHNLAIDIAEGMGMLGLIAALFGAGVAARAIWSSLRERHGGDRWLAAVGASMLVAVAAFSTGSIGLQIALLPLPMWVAFGLVAAGHPARGRPGMAPPRWLRSSAAAATASAVAVAVLLVFVARPIATMAAVARAADQTQAGDIGGAEHTLRLAAAVDPLDVGVRLQLANIHVQSGDETGALSWMREADARARRNGPIEVRLGEISWLMGDIDAAERYFRDAIRDDSWQVLNADPYTPLGLLLLTRGDDAGAKAMLAAGLRVSPVNVRDPAWVLDGNELTIDSAYAPGARPAPRSPLRAALERRMFLPAAPGQTPHPGTLRVTDVVSILEDEAAKTASPARAAEILQQAGLVFQSANLQAGAERVLTKAIAADPAASYARYDLAQSEIALGDDQAAKVALEEVVRRARASSVYDVRIGFAERDLALIAMRQGRYEDAVGLLQAAIADYRWAYLPQAYTALADAYDKLGQGNDAAEWRRRESFLQGR